MPDIQAPELNEIEQVCDFAETRIEQIEHEADHGDADPLGDWEASCLGRVRAWLSGLKKLTRIDRIQMSVAALEAESVDACLMLTISTSHITETAASWMAGEGHPCPLSRYHKGETGWFIPVAMYAAGQEIPDSTPDSVLEVIECALNFGAAWLVLDRDADKLEDLPVYEW